MAIRTFGSQSTSSLHAQTRFGSPVWPARRLTTSATSGNSNRCGVSASRSLGPISGSSLMIVKVLSMTSRNSSTDSKAASGPSLSPTLRMARAVYGAIGQLERAARPAPHSLCGQPAPWTTLPRRGRIPRSPPMSPPIHLNPTAPLAERVLLPGDPGLARAGASGPRKVVSTDLFYDHDTGRQQEWRARGAAAVEMECATLFTLTRVLDIHAGAVLVVSDLLKEPPLRIGPVQLRAAERRMGELAFRALARG